MKFINGKVIVTEAAFPELEHRGYTIIRHTDYYTTFIGVEIHKISAGFSDWNENLKFYIINGTDFTELKIKSAADLCNALNYMDKLLDLRNLKSI